MKVPVHLSPEQRAEIGQIQFDYDMQPAPASVVWLLLKHRGKVGSFEQLCEMVDCFTGKERDRKIAYVIRRAREALRKVEDAPVIESVHDVGYVIPKK